VTVRWLDEGGTLGQPSVPTDWTGIPKPPYWDLTGMPWPPQGQFPTQAPPLWAQTGLPWPPPRPPGYPADWPYPLPVPPPPPALPPLPPSPTPKPPTTTTQPQYADDSASRVGRALIAVAVITFITIVVLR